MPACLLIESTKLAHTVEEFLKQLKARTEACGRHTEFTVNAESDVLLTSFGTHVILT